MTYYGYISAPASNRADWIETCMVLDNDTGDPIDLSVASITMTVINSKRNPNAYMNSGYYGRYDPGVIILRGSTGTGEIVVVDLGTFQWHFTAAQMNSLPQGEYSIGIRLTQDDQTMQLVIGALSVMEGIDCQ
jgi:hypothetical protein